jgi:hypothetical protein
MHSIAPKSAQLHLQIVRFALQLQNPPSSIAPSVIEVLKADLEGILPLQSVSLESYNTEFLQHNAKDAGAKLAAAKAQWYISGEKDREGVASLNTEAVRSTEKPSLQVSLPLVQPV